MVRLKLLGSVACERDGERLEGLSAHQHQIAILALLACASSRRISRGKLVGYLWPETPEQTARSRLSTHVHEIRRELGDEVLLSEGDDLRLNRDLLACDVWRFEEALQAEAWDRAVELYTGPFLDGFRLKGSPAFEKWVSRERNRLDRAYGQALEALGEAAEERGEAAAAVDWWRMRANQDPYDSRVLRRLMEALTAAGNRAEALRVARAHERLMREELEVAPDPTVAELAGTLRAAGADEEVASLETGSRDEVKAAPAAAPGAGEEGYGGEESPRELPRREGERAPVVRVAVVLLVVGVVGAAAWLITGGDEVDEARPTDRGVAILPFEDVGEGEVEEIGQGIYDGVLTNLANVSDLRVTSPRSASRYGGAGATASEIARELGVRWIVDGRVRREGGRIRVHARLIDAREDEIRLAREYERDLTAEGLFAIEGDLATRIAESLQSELTAGERERIGRRPTADLEAYRLYARGRGLLVQRTDSSLNRAEELFRRAVERDSSFAPAWAGLAQALVLYPAARHRDPDLVFPPGVEAARRALELDPALPEAHMALAIVHYYRMNAPESLGRMNRAIELDPNYAKAYHVLNLLHLVMGRPEEARTYAQRAVALSPLSPENQIGLALASQAVGDHERALRAARRVQELEPDYLSGGAYQEAYALYRLGELTEEDTVADGAKRQLLALAAATSGDTEPARELLARYEERLDDPWFGNGLLEAALGRKAESLDTFEAVLRRQETSGGGLTIRLRYLYPEVLGPLREDPRWEDLIREINVAWGLNPDGSLPEGVDDS